MKTHFRRVLLGFAAATLVATPSAAVADEVQCYVTDIVFPSFDMTCAPGSTSR